jgi:O-antigen/teichoic acid export membrane protein
MTSQASTQKSPSPATRIIRRFAQLISAHGVDAIFSGLFFLYLARSDATTYGEVMYALAAGSVLMKVVQFGLYYPLIHELTDSSAAESGKIIGTVNIIKLILLIVSMAGIWALSVFKGLSGRMAWILFLGCLGFGLEALAETFFAHLRVQGRQSSEARIRVVSAILAYGAGFLVTFLRFPAVIIGGYKLMSGAVRLVLSAWGSFTASASGGFTRPDWQSIRSVFLASTVFGLIHILGMVASRTNIFFLESTAGVKSVAVYSAAWMTVDWISALASEQLLAWVVFPLLSVLWMKNRAEVGPIVRRTAQWLMALAFPIIFVLREESGLIVWLLYGSGYPDTVWVQRYLVWTILLSFESHLFSYLMIVAGSGKPLLLFSIVTLAANLVFNVLLVQSFGLAGACLVMILTKGVLLCLTATYCQFRFRLFTCKDFHFLAGASGACVLLFVLLEPLLTLHPAVIVTVGLYLLLLWKPGTRVLGKIPRR